MHLFIYSPMRTYVCINPPFVANEPIDAHTCIIYLCVQDFHTSFRFLHVRSKYMLNTILSVHSRVLSHVKKVSSSILPKNV